MDKKILILFLVAGIAVIFVATALYAGTKVADTITMDYNNYAKRRKAPPRYKVLKFEHKKHNIEYKISCGQCHHDEDNEPLDLKAGDEVQQCVECHTELHKTKENRKDIELLENAFHENCKGCHKEINIKAGDPKGRKGPAPTRCSKCHEKAEK